MIPPTTTTTTTTAPTSRAYHGFVAYKMRDNHPLCALKALELFKAFRKVEDGCEACWASQPVGTFGVVGRIVITTAWKRDMWSYISDDGSRDTGMWDLDNMVPLEALSACMSEDEVLDILHQSKKHHHNELWGSLLWPEALWIKPDASQRLKGIAKLISRFLGLPLVQLRGASMSWEEREAIVDAAVQPPREDGFYRPFAGIEEKLSVSNRAGR